MGGVVSKAREVLPRFKEECICSRKYGASRDTFFVIDTLRTWFQCPSCAPSPPHAKAPEATEPIVGGEVWVSATSGWRKIGPEAVTMSTTGNYFDGIHA